MLMGNDCHDCSKYNRLEMKNVNKDILGWLEDIIEENNSRIERKEWKERSGKANITAMLFMITNLSAPTDLK